MRQAPKSSRRVKVIEHIYIYVAVGRYKLGFPSQYVKGTKPSP